MKLVLRNLLVVLFLVGLSCADALEHYPRPWETETGGENTVFGNNFLLLLAGTIFEPHYADFGYATLQEMQLEQLRAEYNGSGEVLAGLNTAIESQKDALETKKDLQTAGVFEQGGSKEMLYYSYWVSCVDNSFRVLDLSAAKVNGIRRDIESVKGKFISGGVCDNDYSGPNVNYCWDAIEAVSCNYSGAQEDWPDLTWYPDCAREHWQKTYLLELQLGNISAAYAQTVEACGNYIVDASGAKPPATNEMARLKAEKLELIYESGSGSCGSGGRGVGNAYLDLESTKSEGDAALSAAESAQRGKGDRWLKTCIGQSGEATAAYNVVKENCLTAEATEVVDKKGVAAQAALETAVLKGDLLSEYGKALLAEAKKQCAAAQGGPLGERYVDYINCKKNAEAAVLSLGKNPAVETAKLDASFEEVRDLLDKAKQDGLDISAQEKIYGILLSTKPANSEAELASLKEQVLNAAEMRYGNLEGERAKLIGMIEKGGDELSHLYSWFEAEGCFSNKKINYECAIGRLGEIEKSYADISAELTEAKAPVVLAGALIVDSSESWTAAVLDQSGDAYLYVNAVNPLGIGAGNVKITVPAGLDYRKVDVVEGAGEVLMVSSSGGKTEIYLANVSAYENIWIVFKKEDVPCRTTSATEKAWGDPQGGAYVEETIVFVCEHSVESLDLGRGDVEGATLDGVALSANGGAVSREISKGTHTVKIDKYDTDAYSATKETGLVSTVGLKTHVEYFVVIQPNRDMEYLAYLVSENGKGIEELEVFGYSGEKVSEAGVLGGNAIAFKVAGLKEDKETRVRISYYISNAKEYVNASIAYYKTQNLTSEELALLSQAETLAAANNYDAAYVKIEELAEKIRQGDSAYEKLLLKHNKLREELEAKKALLSGALDLAHELNVSNSVTAEMQARLDEINRALALTLERGMLTGPLENFDMGWEGKELTAISKELAAAEKKIKDGWVASGANDLVLAGTIEEIENANNRFDGTKQFDDAMRAYSILALGEGQAESAKAAASAKGIQDKALLDAAILDANELWAKYNAEYSEASGGHWEGLFPESASSLSKKIKALAARKDYAQAILDANALITAMDGTLSGLAEQEASLYDSTNSLFLGMKGQMNEKDVSFVQGALDSATGYAADGQYVLAMKNLEDAVSQMQGAGTKQDGLVVIAITGLLVLGIVALYMLRDKIPKNIAPQDGKRGKEYKKLKREKEAPD